MPYTRAQVRDLVRQRCDLENTTAQQDAEIDNHINDAALWLHDFLIATLGEQYSISTSDVSTVAAQADYDLSSITDFYRLIAVVLILDTEHYPLESFGVVDTVTRTSSQSWGVGYLPRYRIWENHVTQFSVTVEPPPDKVYTLRLHYHPSAPQYANDADVVRIPYPDLLILDAAIRVKHKEERDPSHFLAERAARMQAVQDWVGNVDRGSPPRTMRVAGSRYPGWRQRVF